MSDSTAPTVAGFDIMSPPDHTQLPDRDGSIVTNSQEHPQSELLSTSLLPRLLEVQPDGQVYIGEDVGIYWRYTTPVLAGCKAPDWFCVLGVPPKLGDLFRRSYVLWNEGVPPLLLVEYVSGDGSEEHDRTPHTGKMWVYERGIRAAFYAILDSFRGELEVYHLSQGEFQPIVANAAGRYPIVPLRLELGLWEGVARCTPGLWLRAWDGTSGALLPSAEEVGAHQRARAETAEELLDETRQYLTEETERAEVERKRANSHAARADLLAAKLRALGIDPDAV